MDVGRVGDRGALHRGADRCRGRDRLRGAADLLGAKRLGPRGADRQRLLAGAWRIAGAGAEHQKMRRQPAFGAAGHDHGNALGNRFGRDGEPRR